MKVSLFVTCLTDTFYPRAAIGLVKVLEKLGCELDFPEDQTCCGQPMWNNGFHAETRDLAERMIEVFQDAEYVVTPSGSCAAMIREYYPELFKDDPAMLAAAKDLASRTYEFSEFLVKVLEVDLRKHGANWPGQVTWHFSCHLRSIGMKNETPQLLEQIEGVEYVPLPKADQCCGFGGTFAMKYPDVSGAMARDKAECIASTGADFVVSNDAGCTMNIAGTCRREKVDAKFIHIAELIAESLGLLDRTSPDAPTPEASEPPAASAAASS
ncbi:MAG: (Fe-S)-binding protein [Phycisphaeraceae bacterium]